MIYCIEFEIRYKLKEKEIDPNDQGLLKEIDPNDQGLLVVKEEIKVLCNKKSFNFIPDKIEGDSESINARIYHHVDEKKDHDDILKKLDDLNKAGLIDRSQSGYIKIHECRHDKIPGESTDCTPWEIVDSWGGLEVDIKS